jgi:hypothetical protein
MMDTDESIKFCMIEIVRTGSHRGVKRDERGMRFDSAGIPIWSHVIPVVENFVYEGNVEEYNPLSKPIYMANGAWLTHYKMMKSGESVFVRILPPRRLPPAAV